MRFTSRPPAWPPRLASRPSSTRAAYHHESGVILSRAPFRSASTALSAICFLRLRSRYAAGGGRPAIVYPRRSSPNEARRPCEGFTPAVPPTPTHPDVSPVRGRLLRIASLVSVYPETARRGSDRPARQSILPVAPWLADCRARCHRGLPLGRRNRDRAEGRPSGAAVNIGHRHHRRPAELSRRMR